MFDSGLLQEGLRGFILTFVEDRDSLQWRAGVLGDPAAKDSRRRDRPVLAGGAFEQDVISDDGQFDRLAFKAFGQGFLQGSVFLRQWILERLSTRWDRTGRHISFVSQSRRECPGAEDSLPQRDLADRFGAFICKNNNQQGSCPSHRQVFVLAPGK